MRSMIFIPLFLCCINVNSQVSENWSITTDTYSHNSSNYSATNPPVEIISLPDSCLVVLTQNGSFLKVNREGIILWKKSVENCHFKRMILDSSGHILMTCDRKLKKYNGDGILIWEKDYDSVFKKNYWTIDAIEVYDKSGYFLAGHYYYTNDIVFINIDNSGQLKWRKKIGQKLPGVYTLLLPDNIIFYKNSFFVTCNSYASHKSLVYKVSLNRDVVNRVLDYSVRSVKEMRGDICVTGIDNSIYNAKIYVSVLNTELTKELRSQVIELPVNREYKEKVPFLDTLMKAVRYNAIDRKGTFYRLNSVVYNTDGTIIFAGSSDLFMWLMKVDTIGKTVWRREIKDDQYFTSRIKEPARNQEISTIIKAYGCYFITGVILESEAQKFQHNLNLFVKRLTIEN